MGCTALLYWTVPWQMEEPMAFEMNDYVTVAERIEIFKEKYPNGSLQCEWQLV